MILWYECCTCFALLQFSSVQSLSHVWLFVTPWITAHQASLSITNSWSLHKLMSIESVMPSSHLSSSVVPFSSCSQSLPVSGSFPMSQLFTWGGQSIGVSASASVLPMNTQDWSPSKLWLLEITLMSLVSYPVALLVVCTGQTVAYMNKVMNCQIRLLWAKQWPC